MDNKTMGRLISARRKELNMTQRQLADQLGITDRAVSRWERGVGASEISLLSPLAAALEISTDELLGNAPTTTETPDPSAYTPTKIGIPLFFFYIRLSILLAGWLIILAGAVFQSMLSLPALIATEITGTVIMILGLLSGFLLYRCPRCGHFLNWFMPRASQYQTQLCRTCGQHLYSDKSVRTLKEYRNFKKRSRC